MSDKLNHSDLSALLAKEAKISGAKAEFFTKAMFELIIEGLEQDGIVKINGLGKVPHPRFLFPLSCPKHLFRQCGHHILCSIQEDDNLA